MSTQVMCLQRSKIFRLIVYQIAVIIAVSANVTFLQAAGAPTSLGFSKKANSGFSLPKSRVDMAELSAIGFHNPIAFENASIRNDIMIAGKTTANSSMSASVDTPSHYSMSSQPASGSSTNAPIQPTIAAGHNDVLVNDDTTGGSTQMNPIVTVAADNDGSILLSWSEGGFGVNLWQVGQKYGLAGNALNSPSPLFENIGGYASNITAVVSTSGFQFTWEYDFSEIRYLVTRRFNAECDSIGFPLIIWVDSTYGSDLLFPSCACDDKGNCMVVWEDPTDGHRGIYICTFDSLENVISAATKITDTADNKRGAHAVAYDRAGFFIVTWVGSHSPGNEEEVYAQRFDYTGHPLQSHLVVSEDPNVAKRIGPSQVFPNSDGTFEVIWWASQGADSTFILQRFDSTGLKIGTNVHFEVSSITPSRLLRNKDGRYAGLWKRSQSIYTTFYDSAGARLGSDLIVNEQPENTSYYDAAFDSSSNLTVVWGSRRNYLSGYYDDVFAQQFNSEGSPIGTNFKMVDDTGKANQRDPEIEVDGTGNPLVVWTDSRLHGDFTDIFAQRLDSAGNHIGSNFKINDDTLSNRTQERPDVGMNKSGRYVIAWEDRRRNQLSSDIFAQVYDDSNNPIGANFIINSDSGTAAQSNPAVSLDDQGNSIVVWEDKRADGVYKDIYAQLYDSIGQPFGINFRVNELEHVDCRTPDVAMAPDGKFLIVWDDGRLHGYEGDIFGQLYDSASNPIGPNFQISKHVSSFWKSGIWEPKAAADSVGDFFVTWGDANQSTGYDVYGQRISTNGTPVDTNFKVNASPIPALCLNAKVAMSPDGHAVVTWRETFYNDADSPWGPYVKAQRYDSNGSPQDGNFVVSTLAQTTYARIGVACDAARNYFTWQDYRRSKGADIYFNVFGQTPTDINVNPDVALPQLPELYQNFPNPFNPSTAIEFTAPRRTEAKLEVFNIVGQKVRTLIDGAIESGRHNVVWDGKDSQGQSVASGIYLYRLTIDHHDITRRMILLK